MTCNMLSNKYFQASQIPSSIHELSEQIEISKQIEASEERTCEIRPKLCYRAEFYYEYTL